MKQKIILILSLILIGSFQIYAKDAEASLTITPVAPVEVKYNYSSDKINNLNVVYFIPNNVAVPADYHRRISEILLKAQDFFGKEMERNGYGYKTFGLLKDDIKKRVKLIVIKGSQEIVAYPYGGGAEPILKEIDNYKATHPSEFTGDHNLIITSAKIDQKGKAVGEGVPFYGYDKSCFALDYADLDIKYLGTGGILGNAVKAWIGGMVHELGHGLNLPHNRQKFSSETALGVTLMGPGNKTWGVSNTFLSAVDCAVLNVNQIFNNDNKVHYQASTATIQEIHASYDAGKGAIIVAGKFRSSLAVKDVLYFNDPNVNNEGTGVNKDYNAITWASKPLSPDRFYIEMPIADLEFKNDNIPYELKVMLVQANGNVIETIYSYTFLNGVPVFNFSTRNEISKQGWNVVSFSSEEATGEPDPNGPALNLIDGNGATYWLSKWTVTTAVYPHEFVIDMGSIKTANGLSITQRSGVQCATKSAELFTSTDGANFISAGNYVFAKVNGPQYFDFVTSKAFRYFKVVASTSWDSTQYAALAEVGMY